MTKNPVGTTSQPQQRGGGQKRGQQDIHNAGGGEHYQPHGDATHGGEDPDPAMEETYSAPIGQTAVLIKAIEEALQDERKRIAGLQAHHERLAAKYGNLCNLKIRQPLI